MKPVIDTPFPSQNAAKAHQRLMNREQFGKLILKL
ncbi:MAG: hypothetical protein E2O76_01565 [Caldithrix sp.]|nr:MAG: hypothetical protein E2O76_01565 [Caldithrix sp.]